jgi:hypothetical protein
LIGGRARQLAGGGASVLAQVLHRHSIILSKPKSTGTRRNLIPEFP